MMKRRKKKKIDEPKKEEEEKKEDTKMETDTKQNLYKICSGADYSMHLQAVVSKYISISISTKTVCLFVCIGFFEIAICDKLGTYTITVSLICV